MHSITKFIFSNQTGPAFAPEERNRLVEVRTLLVEAHRKAREIQTRNSIRNALRSLNPVLFEMGVIEGNTVRRNTPTKSRRPEVCPEMRTVVSTEESDFPQLYRPTKCVRQPVQKLVTVLLYPETIEVGCTVVKRIHSLHPQLPIILATNSEEVSCAPLVDLRIIPEQFTEPQTWRILAQEARTKYILVARNMVTFSEHTDIDRLLRVLNDWALDIVGGAVRLEPEGQWHAGCYKTAVKNFTIRFQPGYDRSVQSCAYCDYISSPFLIRRALFLEHWQERLTGRTLPFVDMFLQLVHKSVQYHGVTVRTNHVVSCFDVLFHVAGNNASRGTGGGGDQGLSETPKSIWLQLAKLWIVSRILLPGPIKHTWNCSEVDINCENFAQPGYVMPPCCLWELAYCVNAFFQFALRENVSICFTSDSLLTALKVTGGLAPWTHEFEVTWDVYQLATLGRFVQRSLDPSGVCTLTQREYLTMERERFETCARHAHAACLHHTLTSFNWRIQLAGRAKLLCSRKGMFVRSTRVSMLGHWVPTVYNPGRYVRHLYGDDVLVPFVTVNDITESESKESGLDMNPTQPCSDTQPKHACVSGQFVPHGNVQFQKIIV
ncbi:unnamed protein product [Echinostoma caproni]|uniref:Uncharacterized protein n=1 Tax=Echinostoma caproni TaxID=27848 RepID=A0A183ACI5_9TREM|nr:unnamed protein product [Echinostoma caproni]